MHYVIIICIMCFNNDVTNYPHHLFILSGSETLRISYPVGLGTPDLDPSG